jgi:hypothetical protein
MEALVSESGASADLQMSHSVLWVSKWSSSSYETAKAACGDVGVADMVGMQR